MPSMRHMVVIVPELTGYASIRHIAVSLPYASQLIDHVKYMEPQDVKPPEGEYRAPPPACTARAVNTQPGQVGPGMPIGRGIGPAAETPLPAAATAPGIAAGWPQPRRGRG